MSDDADDTATDDTATAKAEAEAEPELAADDEATRPAADANVVSLFRGRPAPQPDADETDIGADTDTGEGEGDAPDADAVGGLFARLRDELPAEVDTTTEAETASEADTEAETDAGTEADGEIETDTETGAAGETERDAAVAAAVDTAFSRRDEALVPLIVSAARKIKRVLADEQNLVLDTLRQKEPVTELDDVVPGIDQHTATYRSAIADELTGAATAGAVELGAGDTRTLRNRLGKAGALDEATALMRTALIGPLRDRIARSIADGAGDNEAIAKRVRAVYREWKTQHIDGQLDDVFRYAHGGGVAVTAEPGAPMVWTIDPSEPACPDCEDNSLSGEVPAGEPFPTGHTAAPAHPGCRCLVLPAG